MTEAFHDAKQILDLKDNIDLNHMSLILSTVMLDSPKVIHGRKYWFETYVIKIKDEKVSTVMIMGQYLTAYEAMQSHKSILAGIGNIIQFIKEDDLSSAPQPVMAPKPKKSTKTET